MPQDYPIRFPPQVSKVRFSPDSGNLGSACVDKVFRVYDVKTLKEVASYASTNDGMWSPDLAAPVSLHGGEGGAAGGSGGGGGIMASRYPTLLLVFSTDLGVVRLIDPKTYVDVAAVYFQFQVSLCSV